MANGDDGRRLSVERLASLKHLPVGFLRGLHLADVPGGGVTIPYSDVDGRELYVRRRGVPGRPRFEQPAGVRLAPYGRWRLRDAAEEGYLILVEGESDCWALWYHGLPALGVPGSGSASCLTKEDLATVRTLYVHREPDSGGPRFVAGVAARLRDLGWEGEAWEFDLGQVKDPSDLHVRAGDFKAVIRQAISASEPLPPAPPEPSPASRAAAEVAEPPIPDPTPWPDPPAKEAFHGLAGDFVRLVDPETESDPTALLGQFLVAFGNVVGRHVWQNVGYKRHHCNLFIALVGPTSKGRKGTALDWVRHVFAQAEPSWDKSRVLSGLSSGEGLINAVRDGDADVHDKRLLAIEEELASVLRASGRDGSILSSILRKAWDGGVLGTLTRHQPLVATGSHVSMIAHVTKPELLSTLTSTDQSNGVANRILWLAVRRSKLLPHGGREVCLTEIVEALKGAIRHADFRNVMGRSKECDQLWAEVYPRLSADRPGIMGQVTGRAEAQVLRLSLIYALLDRADAVCVRHLQAALALWDYCERSCQWVFGERNADPDADLLLASIRQAEPIGLDGRGVHAVFANHMSSAKLRALLGKLLDSGLIRKHEVKTSGRPRTLWRVVKNDPENAKQAKNTNNVAPQGLTSKDDLDASSFPASS